MGLPGVNGAVVDPAKVRGYLLSDAHPVGRHKAAFFKGLGYTAQNGEQLAADLLEHARAHPAVLVRLSKHGQKFEVRGRIRGPSGGVAVLVSVWIVLRGHEHPRFVTAYPRTKA